MENQDIQKFLEVHAKNHAQPVSDEIIERYVNVFPELLLKFWKEHGFGTYGKGFIQFINPDEYRETLNMWLMRNDDGTRIPFAMSAFGDLFYWRHLYNPNPDDDFPQWVFDVSYFNPHNSETGLCTYTMEEFFGGYIVNKDIIDVFKWKYHSGYSIGLVDCVLNDHLNSDNTLFDKAVKKLGVLEQDEMYLFAPALRLGGIDDIEYVHKGNALVQLDILFQLTGEEAYDSRNDLYDYYTETEKLTTPADFDRRIEELKSEMDGSNDASKHYLIGKLFDEYPYYDDTINNSEEVNRRVKEQALFHHTKAKELEPENGKYFYASFNSQLADYNRNNWNSAESDLERFYELNGDEESYLRGKYNIANYKNNDQGVLEFSEKLYEYTGNLGELMNSAFYFSSKNNLDKSFEINERIFNSTDDFYYAKTSTRAIADIYRQRKQKDESLKIFEKLKNRFPHEEANIFNEIAVFTKTDYDDKNRLENAINYFKLAISKGEENLMEDYDLANLYCNLFHAYEEKGDFENAKNTIEKAYEVNNDSYYLDEKARLLYKMGNEEEAKQTFSNSEYGHTNFTKKFDDGNWQEIVWALDSSPNAFEQKINKIEADLKQNPINAQKQFLLAKLYENYPVYMMDADKQDTQYKHIAKNAFVAYQAATDLEKENALYQLHLADFIYNNHYYLELEDNDRNQLMHNGYQFYIDNAENPYEGYEGLKRIAQYEDDWENIIKYAKLAYNEKPEMTHELLDLGYAYTESGRYPEAIQIYQEFLLSEPNFHQQLNGKQGIAQAYIKSGDVLRAENMFEDIAKNAENNAEKYDVYQKASDAFKMSYDYDTAIKFQEKAVYFAEHSGDHFDYPTSFFELSSLYEQKGNFDEAISIGEKICKIRGEEYDFARLANLQCENGQLVEAENNIRKALQINPDDDYSKSVFEEILNRKRGSNKKSGGFFNKFFGK